jgi:hypothetical protein
MSRLESSAGLSTLPNLTDDLFSRSLVAQRFRQGKKFFGRILVVRRGIGEMVGQDGYDFLTEGPVFVLGLRFEQGVQTVVNAADLENGHGFFLRESG